jgi:3-oxoacyl-[acyl-carrier protein] reductase
VGELRGSVAVVTGSTRGIGRAIAERFAAESASVVVNGRDAATVDAVARELGSNAVGAAGDMGDAEQAASVIQRAVDEWGRLDILVNNAGIAIDHFVTRLSDDDWSRVLSTNLGGPFFAIRAAVPLMKEAGSGSIVNVVSWSGQRGNVGQAAYASSKAGLVGLTLTCAKELGKFGIRVNALSPSVPTDISADMSDELLAKVVGRTPLKRHGTLEEVAEGALFLAGPRSSFTTGQILNVDGGLHLN